MGQTIPIENSGQIGIIVGSTLSIFIAAIFVFLRLVAKHISSGLDYSEYCIVAALIWNTGLHTCLLLLVTHGGFGFHLTEILSRFGPDVATFFFKGIMSFALLWNATVCFSKLSVLLMYCQLMPVPSMIKWCKIMGVLIIAWNVGDIIGGFLICRPLARNWDFTIEGTCGSQPNYYFAMGMINIISDVFLLGLPMPYIYKLRMPMRKKLIAASMLSIGIMTWIVSIYRQVLLPGLDFTDMTYDGVLVTLLSGVEPAVAIALACLPLLRPLLGRRKLSAKHSGYEYGSNGGSSGLYRKEGLRSGSRPFDPLEDDHDDNDASSEVQLHPIKPVQDTMISASTESKSDRSMTTTTTSNGIAVEKRWEITSVTV